MLRRSKREHRGVSQPRNAYTQFVRDDPSYHEAGRSPKLGSKQLSSYRFRCSPSAPTDWEFWQPLTSFAERNEPHR
jgi:hypothetical protein